MSFLTPFRTFSHKNVMVMDKKSKSPSTAKDSSEKGSAEKDAPPKKKEKTA